MYLLRTLEVALNAHQSVDGTYPDSTLLVFYDVAHLGIETIGRVVLETVLLVVERQLSVLILVDQVQSSVKRSHPYVLPGVDIGEVDVIAADARGIGGLVAIVLQLITHGLRTVRCGDNQSITFCRQPQASAIILCSMIDGSYAILRIRQCALQQSLVVVDVHIATACAHQDAALTGLVDAAHASRVIVGQGDEVKSVAWATDAV